MIEREKMTHETVLRASDGKQGGWCDSISVVISMSMVMCEAYHTFKDGEKK